MARIIIATPELSDAATLTSSTTASSMPATNLQKIQPGEPATFTTPGAAWVEIDLLSAKSINLIWLGYTNASATATWRIRAATTQGALTTSPGYDSGSMAHQLDTTQYATWDRTHATKWLSSSPQTFRWWRIDVNDSSNSEGVYRAGRLYLASAFQPSNNARYGSSISIAEEVRRTESLGGNVHTRRAARKGAQEFVIEYLTKAEMLGTIHPLVRKRGVSQDILVILDPAETVYLMELTTYGLLREVIPITINATGAGPRFSVSLSVDEMP